MKLFNSSPLSLEKKKKKGKKGFREGGEKNWAPVIIGATQRTRFDECDENKGWLQKETTKSCFEVGERKGV